MKNLKLLFIAFALLNSSLIIAQSEEGLDGPVRPFVWLTLGFPSATEYNSADLGLTTADKVIITQNGMVGRINELRTLISTTAVSGFSNIASCQDVPEVATSSVNITGGGTLRFTAPLNNSPTHFPTEGAAYEKRAEFSAIPNGLTNQTVEGFFEFMCDTPKSMAYIVTKSGSTIINRILIYFDGEDEENKFLDLYMIDNGAISFTGTGREMQLAVQLRVLPNNRYSLAVTRTGTNSSDEITASYRAMAHGNFATQKAFFIFNDRSGYDEIAASDYETNAGGAYNYAHSVLVAPTMHIGAQSGNPTSTTTGLGGGCASTWTQVYSQTLTYTNVCNDGNGNLNPMPTASVTSLSTIPFGGAGSKMSYSWLLNNMKTKMSELDLD